MELLDIEYASYALGKYAVLKTWKTETGLFLLHMDALLESQSR
jgi:hypothetical protein